MNAVSNAQRVAVAMSGGVDSSVAAALLHDQGYEVFGIMLRLYAPGGTEENRCCTPQAVEDARSVCQALGVPFYLMNVEREFERVVVEYFKDEYAAGRTPNPCLKCNRHIRFELLLKRALAMGADYLATGHYARVRGHNGSYQLLRAVDPAKDQCYVLCMLGQEQLAHALFPIGEHTKPKVRALARQFGLRVAEKVESQDLCFVPDGDHAAFLERFAGLAPNPGPILTRSGQVLGEHRGLWHYTVGQRRGLGIATGEPLYVLELDAQRNGLVVGSADELGCRELWAKEVNYIQGLPSQPLEVTAKIRYKAADVPATLYPLEAGQARVVFENPVRAAAPGQAVVFYQGEVLLGGGFIESIG